MPLPRTRRSAVLRATRMPHMIHPTNPYMNTEGEAERLDSAVLCSPPAEQPRHECCSRVAARDDFGGPVRRDTLAEEQG